MTEDEKTEKCDECDGAGKVECEYCDGDGTVECDDCSGAGTVAVEQEGDHRE